MTILLLECQCQVWACTVKEIGEAAAFVIFILGFIYIVCKTVSGGYEKE